jgi:chromate reductase, NAD(P)H dehydrogenase (quinone)
MRIFAVSGSLRFQSSNTRLLQALKLIAPSYIEIRIFEGLSAIPAFNPDLEGEQYFEAVDRFAKGIRDSDAVVFSTPEYAHGIPGSLKNALDWIVGSGELSEKPVTLINASSRGAYAQAALKEVLTTMNARTIWEAEITIDLRKRDITPQEIADLPGFPSIVQRTFSLMSKAASLSANGLSNSAI